MSKGLRVKGITPEDDRIYGELLGGIGALLEMARAASVRAVNAVMTATYWEVGRRIIEFEQGGQARARYGSELLKRLSDDLGARLGRGFSPDNLERCRLFYTRFSPALISATSSRISGGSALSETPTHISAAVSRKSDANHIPIEPPELARAFSLPWSHYVLLIRLRSRAAVLFYHAEALRGGWTVRQLKRQIDSQFYERTALSRNRAAMLRKGQTAKPEDTVSTDEQIKDPLVLEFLGLKDEYSESTLEEALIRHLETFLLELGNDFAFVGRQRRLRIDDEWFRVDLLLFHRRLRCLVIIDLKLGRFSHADAGQMHLYLNYAREHWTHADENPPVGIILCTGKGEALVRYATEGLPNKLLVREYLTALPDEKLLASEIDRTRAALEGRAR
jgi:predicted nuclease of restriction endonuclease-like (RecB) superfamily